MPTEQEKVSRLDISVVSTVRYLRMNTEAVKLEDERGKMSYDLNQDRVCFHEICFIITQALLLLLSVPLCSPFHIFTAEPHRIFLSATSSTSCSRYSTGLVISLSKMSNSEIRSWVRILNSSANRDGTM